MDIQPISASERSLSGLDYFLLWAGVAISLAEIWAGGFLAPMGFWLGILAILVGHIIGNTFMALGGIIGSEYGIMSMVSVRPSFGIRGSSLAAVLNIIQLIGWASIMLIIGGRAGAMLGKPIGGNSGIQPVLDRRNRIGNAFMGTDDGQSDLAHYAETDGYRTAAGHPADEWRVC